MPADTFTLTDIERACGVTMDDVHAYAATSYVTDDMAVIDRYASPAQAGAAARYLLAASARFSHLAHGCPVYVID